MSDNQATQNRECLWCETPIEGRTDKQFCSSACKARHNRDNPKNEPAERYLPAVATRPAVSATSIRYVEPVEEDEAETEDENWEVAYEREQQAKRDKEEASRLHRIYAQQATQFLKQEGLTYSWRSLDDSGEELDEAADKYRQHPGLPDPDHPAHRRLADLYLMRDILRTIGEAMAEAEEAATSFFGKSRPEPVLLHLTKKHRKRLRENLLGVE